MAKRGKKANGLKIIKPISPFFVFAIAIVLILALALYFIRTFGERQVDDVNPLSDCPDWIMQKSKVYAVIPLYKNVSIVDNKSWCDYILSLNKTLIMHGIYHNYEEFESNISKEEVILGMNAFKKCFGYYPEIFEAPQLAISGGNELMILDLGMKLRGYPYALFHKVYHCNSYGERFNDLVDKF